MESKSAEEIATALGVPTANLLGTQDWASPLYPGLIVSQLHYSDGTPIQAFRISNKITAETFSKIPEENAPGDVDKLHAAIVAVHQKISFEVIPAIYAAVPDLDPSAEIVRGLTVGGKEMIADLVVGQVQNLRPSPVFPVIGLDANGKIAIDSSKLTADQRVLVDAEIAKIDMDAPVNLADVIATRAIKGA